MVEQLRMHLLFASLCLQNVIVQQATQGGLHVVVRRQEPCSEHS